jgi:hypothetical protein
MGCITLEFVVWLLYGADGLRSFSIDRQNDPGGFSGNYRGTFHDGVQISRAVLRWLHKLRRCDHLAKLIIESILDLVQQSMLRKEPEHRLLAGDIHRSFQDILHRAEEEQLSSCLSGVEVPELALDTPPDLEYDFWGGSSKIGCLSEMPQAHDSWCEDSAVCSTNTKMTNFSWLDNNATSNSSTGSMADAWAYNWQSRQETVDETDLMVMSSFLAPDSACLDMYAQTSNVQD